MVKQLYSEQVRTPNKGEITIFRNKNNAHRYYKRADGNIIKMDDEVNGETFNIYEPYITRVNNLTEDTMDILDTDDGINHRSGIDLVTVKFCCQSPIAVGGRGRGGRDGTQGATGSTGPIGATGTACLQAFGYVAGQNNTVIGANSDVVFDLGATPFPNQGFTSVPAPGGTTFVIATSGAYEFDFYVAGTHASGATTSLEFALWRNGAVASVGGNAFEFRSNQQGGAGDIQVVRGQGIIALTAGDVITLHNRTNTVTDAVTVTSIPPGGEAGPNRTLSLILLCANPPTP